MPAMAARHFLGRGNPKELGADSLGMYPISGRVYSVAEFVEEFIGKLASHEQVLVRRHLAELAIAVIPEDLIRCLTRSGEFASNETPILTARRSGGRSAFLPERRLKFKGCRPVLDGATYPL